MKTIVATLALLLCGCAGHGVRTTDDGGGARTNRIEPDFTLRKALCDHDNCPVDVAVIDLGAGCSIVVPDVVEVTGQHRVVWRLYSVGEDYRFVANGVDPKSGANDPATDFEIVGRSSKDRYVWKSKHRTLGKDINYTINLERTRDSKPCSKDPVIVNR